MGSTRHAKDHRDSIASRPSAHCQKEVRRNPKAWRHGGRQRTASRLGQKRKPGSPLPVSIPADPRDPQHGSYGLYKTGPACFRRSALRPCLVHELGELEVLVRQAADVVRPELDPHRRNFGREARTQGRGQTLDWRDWRTARKVEDTLALDFTMPDPTPPLLGGAAPAVRCGQRDEGRRAWESRALCAVRGEPAVSSCASLSPLAGPSRTLSLIHI